MPIRQPIITLLGHIDHGKTTLLDGIRGTLIQKKEAKGITQHIGATEVPSDVIKSICEDFLKKFKFEVKIPGILFIDTPGHEAFLSLRERGSSIADLAVLVIDINEGFQNQTYECIELLKRYKVPFLVAATKIDLIPGWISQNTLYFSESIKYQRREVVDLLEERLYRIVAQLSELGFESERFDRVTDFTKQVCIVPVSGITKEGIAELIALIVGLSQRFLGKRLEIDPEGSAKGTIIEVKELKHMGKVVDVILYDGMLNEGDEIVVPTLQGILVTKIRGIYKPKPLEEIRMKAKFERVDKVYAACGVRLVLSETTGILAGVPFVEIKSKEEIKKIEEEFKKLISSYIFEKSIEGVIVKADTFGSIEAIITLFNKEGIPIRKTGIGEVTKKDIIEAAAVKEKKPEYGVIFAFNIKVDEEIEKLAKEKGVKLFESNVIYELTENYKEWVNELKKKKREEILSKISLPCKIKILPGYVFRQSKPAIVGIEVIAGIIRPGVELMRLDGKKIGVVLSLQIEGRNVKEGKKGERLACAIEGAWIGRNVKEGEILISDLKEYEYKILKKELKDELSEDDIKLLEEIREIKKKKDPLWGLK